VHDAYLYFNYFKLFVKLFYSSIKVPAAEKDKNAMTDPRLAGSTIFYSPANLLKSFFIY